MPIGTPNGGINSFDLLVGETLVVTASAGSVGRVVVLESSGQIGMTGSADTVTSASPITKGPYAANMKVRVYTETGSVSVSTSSPLQAIDTLGGAVLSNGNKTISGLGAKPDSTVLVYDRDTGASIGSVKADARGDWTLSLKTALTPGQRIGVEAVIVLPYVTVLAPVGADTTPPVIASSASQTVAENSAFSLTLSANEAANWTKTGGADAALFVLSGNVLSLSARNFEDPTDADKNNVYVVQVTATDAAGNASRLTISVTVTDVDETVAPQNVSSPVISGTPQVGQTLSASNGSWTNSPTSYAYQWNRAGTPITGATSAIYVPISADVGNALSITVTATNSAGSATSTSAATSAISAAAPVLATLTPSKATFTTDAPAGTVIWVAANKTTGSTITFSPNDGRVAVDNAGRLVVGLSASSVGTITGSLVEKLDGATGSPKTSPITITVTQPVSNAAATRPMVTGTPMSSEVLTAYVGNLGSGSGQWLRSGTAISGATSNTYTLTDADIGSVLSYRYTPSSGSAVVSAPTDVVQQVDYLTDAAGNRITDASGNPITLGYNYAYNPITDASGNVITDNAGNPICTVSPAPVQQQVRLLAPFSPSSNTFNQNTLPTAPITFAMADVDRYVPAVAGVPWQIYAPNMSRVEVWAAGAAIATVVGSDAQGYFRGTLDLSGYLNGPRWFEVRAFDKSTIGGSSVSIQAGVHLVITGGKNANKSQLPAAAQANGFALQFIDDFSTLSVSQSQTNDGARWYDNMPNNRVFGDQIFTRASSAQNPFTILGSFLRIRETYDANFAGGQSGLKHWFSGLLASAFPDGTTNIPTANGYYEADIMVPTGSGTWPAFWLLDQDVVKDATRQYSHREIDFEQYNYQQTFWTATTHRYAASTAADTFTNKRIVTPEQKWEFHRVGFFVSDTKIDYYYDDVLVFSDTNFVTSGPNPRNNMVLFNLALTPGGNNSPETPPPGSYYDMFVDSFRYYA